MSPINSNVGDRASQMTQASPSSEVKGLGSDVEGMITRDTVGELLSDNPRLNECSIEGERLGPDLASPSKFTKHTVEDLLKDASKLKAKGSIEDKDALIERLLEYVKWQSSENKKLEEDLDHSLAKVLKFDEVLKTNQAAMEEILMVRALIVKSLSSKVFDKA